jgi:hypothetical protein
MTNLNHTLTKSIINILSDTFIQTTKPYEINHRLFNVVNPVRLYTPYSSLSYCILSNNTPSEITFLKRYYNQPTAYINRHPR